MLGRFVPRSAAGSLVGLSLALSATGLGTGGVQATQVQGPPPNQTVRIANIPVPGSPLRSFDISWVDQATAHYYLADRSNKSIDVMSTVSQSFSAQIPGFVGFTGNNDTSGPNGVVVTFSGRELWAGDGDSTVKVIDLGTNSIVATISTGGKDRADELAYDPKDNLILIANDADDPPYLSLISVGTRQVLKKIAYPTADNGLEQPIYDADTGMFYQAVPSLTTQEGGQIDVIDPLKMAVVNSYNLSGCQPHGIALGPGNQLLAGCSLPGRSTLLDKTNGTILAEYSQPGAGGADETWYNPGDGRYYLAESTPQLLGIIDAASMTFVGAVQSGLLAHSVAADQQLNHVFVPIAGPDKACPTGCIAVFTGVATDSMGISRAR